MSSEKVMIPTLVVDNEADYFADPRKTTKLPIPAINGWVEVRDEVSIGEERRVFANAIKGVTETADGRRLDYDSERVSFGNNVVHIVDWSLKKDFSADALKALKPHIYRAIDDAIQQHINRVTEGNATPLPSSSGSETSGSAA